MMKAATSRFSTYQLFAMLAIVAAISGAAAYYASWWWIAEPQNQQRFEKLIERNADIYNQKTERYLITLKQTITELANQVPDDIFTSETPPSLLSRTPKKWLDEHRLQWQKQLPEAISFTLFSTAKIEEISLSLLSNNLEKKDALKKYNVNFLFLDMVNRLKDQRPLYTEAAKISGTHKWQLHHMVAINDTENNMQGVLYSVLNLQGILKSWGNINTLLGKISISQKVEQGKPLHFFSVGATNVSMRPIEKSIANSYWLINYQPSLELQQQNKNIPIVVWLMTFGFPLLVVFLGTWLILRLYPKITKTLTSTASNDNTKSTLENTEKNAVLINEKNNTAEDEYANEEKIVEAPSVISKVDRPNTDSDGEEEISFPENIFRAYDIRGLAHEELSHDIMYAIGQAFATEVLLAGDTSAIVAWDARTHSPEFSVCLLKGIQSTGCHTVEIGIGPTPLMNFAACEHNKTSSGIIITASHNPKNYNGCKMVVNGRTLVDDDIQRIKTRIQQGDVTSAENHGVTTKEDFSQMYIDRIMGDVAVIDGWQVVVDAGNGASSELAPRLLNALQCKTHPLFCQFDGEFPNHDPDPSVVENLTSLVDAVKTHKADIGFALDGDGDRLIAVTALGKIVWPDQLMMLFSQDIVARNPGCDVVFDIKSSQLLSHVISENGGRPIMWKTGHSHIKAKMHETQALLGGEFSGHIFFKERWYGFDDGLYAAARLLEILTLTGQTLDELVDALPSRVSTPEIKIATTEEKKFIFINQLIEKAEFPDGQRTTIDGLRIDFSDGWGLVRASNTAPVLTLRFEASNENALERIKQQFKNELVKIDSTLTLNF
jgi:phosphomannomutase / phosphoglucomutase